MEEPQSNFNLTSFRIPLNVRHIQQGDARLTRIDMWCVGTAKVTVLAPLM